MEDPRLLGKLQDVELVSRSYRLCLMDVLDALAQALVAISIPLTNLRLHLFSTHR